VPDVSQAVSPVETHEASPLRSIAVAETSRIEWTDATWNPVRGCTKVSAGCAFCYAERFSERFRGVPNHPFEQGFDLRLVPDKLRQPHRWRRPRRVFVSSMSDLFHPGIPTTYIAAVGEVMQATPHHTYQVLSKRHERMHHLLLGELNWMARLPNVWYGVSVENRRQGLPRLQLLRRTPATVRFLSIEPLLEDLGSVDFTDIHWVIVGGESGPGARPMKEAWVRSLLEQARRDAVPFFFKQWGGPRKHLTGRLLGGRTYDEFPAPK